RSHWDPPVRRGVIRDRIRGHDDGPGGSRRRRLERRADRDELAGVGLRNDTTIREGPSNIRIEALPVAEPAPGLVGLRDLERLADSERAARGRETRGAGREGTRQP